MLEKNVKTLGGNLAKCTTDLNIKLHCYKGKLEKKTEKLLLIMKYWLLDYWKTILENNKGKRYQQ